MAIVDILRVKFNFLAKRLPKLFIKQYMRQKSEEGKSKHNDLYIITDKQPLINEERIEDTDLTFYSEYTKRYSIRGIDDMLQETKHIVQKMIALMQSVINTLRGCPGIYTDSNLSQLSNFFRGAINYFVIKMAIHQIHGNNLANEKEDMEKNVKLFLETFMRMDLGSFGQIMENVMGFLCECISTPVAAEALKKVNVKNDKVFDNDFLMVIPKYIKDKLLSSKSKGEAIQEHIKDHAGLFAYLLLKHLLEQFDLIGGYKVQSVPQANIPKYSHYLSLFKIAMEILLYVDYNEQINSFFFKLITLSMKYSRKSLLFDNYFLAFKIVWSAIKLREGTRTHKGISIRENRHLELASLLLGLLPIFLSLSKEHPTVNKLIIELVPSFIPFPFLIEYLPMLIRPFTEYIANSHSTSSSAFTLLEALENWLLKQWETPELLDVLYDMVPELIPALHKLYCKQNISDLTNKMLASFGGRSKPYITEKEAVTKF